MKNYKLEQNEMGFDLYIEGFNILFIVIHDGILYINTTPEQKENFLHFHAENKLPDFFTILRHLQNQFSADCIIVVNTVNTMASLLTEEEWRRYGFKYDEVGLLKAK